VILIADTQDSRVDYAIHQYSPLCPDIGKPPSWPGRNNHSLAHPRTTEPDRPNAPAAHDPCADHSSGVRGQMTFDTTR
jgi:hypothetical protein